MPPTACHKRKLNPFLSCRYKETPDTSNYQHSVIYHRSSRKKCRGKPLHVASTKYQHEMNLRKETGNSLNIIPPSTLCSSFNSPDTGLVYGSGSSINGAINSTHVLKYLCTLILVLFVILTIVDWSVQFLYSDYFKKSKFNN